MPIKLELPDHVVRELLEQWEREAVELDGRLTEIKGRIASAQAQLNGQYPRANAPGMPLLEAAKRLSKRAKGENLRTVSEYLARVPGGATVAAIHKGTGVGISSIRAVLDRHNDTFAKGQDGLWKLKSK